MFACVTPSSRPEERCSCPDKRGLAASRISGTVSVGRAVLWRPDFQEEEEQQQQQQQQTLANPVTVNPHVGSSGSKYEKCCSQLSTCFKRHMAPFRKADETCLFRQNLRQFLQTCIITFKKYNF
jgi:hypothetical protein